MQLIKINMQQTETLLDDTVGSRKPQYDTIMYIGSTMLSAPNTASMISLAPRTHRWVPARDITEFRNQRILTPERNRLLRLWNGNEQISLLMPTDGDEQSTSQVLRAYQQMKIVLTSAFS